MAQNTFKINNTPVFQPDSNPQWSWETIYTADTQRLQGSGTLIDTPLWTTQSWEYHATNIPVADAMAILRMVIPTPNSPHYTINVWNPYNAAWESVECYTGQGSMHIGTLVEDEEYYEDFSFNMVGVRKLV